MFVQRLLHEDCLRRSSSDLLQSGIVDVVSFVAGVLLCA
jgi:hypothetical protein